LSERLGQRRHRLAGEFRTLGHGGEIGLQRLRRLEDGVGRVLRDDSKLALGAGQRRLDREHGGEPADVREEIAHLLRAVEPAIDIRIRRIDRHEPPAPPEP
jgi:hypothetical protein